MVARKTSSAPTRIWSFGSRITTEPENVDRLWGIMKAARDYGNTLLALHAEHVTNYRAIRETHEPDLAVLRAKINDLSERCDALQAEGKKLRAAKAPKNEREAAREALYVVINEKQVAKKREHEARTAVEESLKAGRAELARRVAEQCGPSNARTVGPRIVEPVTFETRRAMRKENTWSELWRDLDAEEERYLTAQKLARSRTSLSSGCYLLVEESVKQAIKDASPEQPKPRGLSHGARIGVQLTGLVTWADVISGACSKVRVETLRPARNDGTRRGASSIVRVGVRVEAKPEQWVWVTAKLHRQPPADVVVKKAWICIWRVGLKLQAEVQFVLESQSFSAPTRPVGFGHVVIRPCCVLAEDGITVTLYEGEGRSGAITIPNKGGGDPKHKRTRDSLLARLVYHEAWASALDTAHATALEVLDPGDNDKSLPARRGLERLMLAWCAERWRSEDLHAMWKLWVTERKANGLHLLDRPGADTQLEGWWPEETQHWLLHHVGAIGPEVKEADVRAWWAYTWAKQSEHLAQEKTRARLVVIRQRDALFRREAIRLATQFETAHIQRPEIASKKRQKSLHAEALREVLQLVGVARCAEILAETFDTRAKVERGGDLIADTGAALRDMLDRAAKDSGQERRSRRRRPERERRGAALSPVGARKTEEAETLQDSGGPAGGE